MQFIADAVWEKDETFQRDVLTGFIRNIRGFGEELSGLALQDLIDDKMFYVPHDEYLIEKVGVHVKDARYGLYRGTFCTLNSRLAIPLRVLDDTVIGYIGYTNQNDFHTDDASFIKYLYPSKTLFKKSNYLYITKAEYLKALREGYICIVDGIFDKRRLQSLGINACSLCGSTLTKNQAVYLEMIKHKVVIADNDDAGRKMAQACKRYLSNCVEIRQSDTNDIDDFLRRPENITKVKDLIEEMKTEDFIISREIKSSLKWGHQDFTRYEVQSKGGAK